MHRPLFPPSFSCPFVGLHVAFLRLQMINTPPPKVGNTVRQLAVICPSGHSSVHPSDYQFGQSQTGRQTPANTSPADGVTNSEGRGGIEVRNFPQFPAISQFIAISAISRNSSQCFAIFLQFF